MLSFAVATILALVGSASAAQFIVAVGENNGVTYDPTSVNASVGDTIAFQFKAKNHTVTQSTFADPCTQMTTPALGIDSGFMAVTGNGSEVPQWSFTINNASTPLWFFCRQTGHCAQGMVFAVNPSPNKTYAMFQAAAMATNSTNTTSSTASSGSTASPSASAVSGNTNGASTRVSLNAATILSIVGLAAGIML